jgi:hypothetical protein
MIDLFLPPFISLFLGMYVMIIAKTTPALKSTILSAVKLLNLSSSPNDEIYWWLEVMDISRRIYTEHYRL